MSCVTDESDKPREGYIASMVEIGSKQPNLVVSTIVTFVTTQGSKVICLYLDLNYFILFEVDQAHRVSLLKILHTVIEAGAREKIEAELAHELITFCTAEMVASAVCVFCRFL